MKSIRAPLAVWALVPLLLAACATEQSSLAPENERGTGEDEMMHVVPSMPDDAASTLPILPIPSEYSIEAFRAMRLSGTGLSLMRVLEENASYTRHQISYRSNGLLISGILNIPKGDGPFPVLILNHGYIDPAVYTNGRGLRREQDYLARRGFVVLHTDYRGHAFSDPSPDTHEMYDAGIEYAMDSANAILALREAALPGVDPYRVGMVGHSMGGGVTLNILVAHPDLVDAAMLYAPVHADAWENFNRWRRMREEGDNTLRVLLTREENPEGWDRLSSQSYLEKIRVPVLVFHGSNDRDVPKEWSDELVERLSALRKEVEYVEYRGEGHEFGPQWNDFMQRTAAFFAERLAAGE